LTRPVWSLHNSQHLLDPYSFTHALQGMLLYAVLRLASGSRWPNVRLVLAVLFEVGWELVENTDRVIMAYRESTIALNYHGDSIANSVSDVVTFVLGYAIAMRLPVWISVSVSRRGRWAAEAAELAADRVSATARIGAAPARAL
jgi:Protein of unknown function (DUF2585)